MADDETPPKALDKIGKGEWMRIVPELRASGVLTKVDEKILWGYCHHFSIAEQCVVKINEQGLMIRRTPRSKYLTENPYLSIQNKALDKMKSFAIELGITPASRSRVSSTPTTPDDPMAELKRRRAERLAAVQAKFKRGKNPHDPHESQ